MDQQIINKKPFLTAVAAIFVLLLTSCATPKPKTTKPVKEETQTQIETQQQATLNADYYIKAAKSASPDDSLTLLVTASEQLIIEQQYEKALWLANHVEPLLVDLTQNNQSLEQAKQDYRIKVVKAQALAALQEYTKAADVLSKAQQITEDNRVQHNLAYYQVSIPVQMALNHNVEALAAKMHSFKLSAQASEEQISQIWQAISGLSAWQLQQLKSLSAPFSKGWIQLSNYARRFGASDSQFKRYLTQWQKQFPTHPAQVVASQLLEQPDLAIPQPQNIAVILPLSGSQQQAGFAAQQGILAAYQHNKDKQLTFIDANTTDWSALNQQLIEQDIDYVIGPLLRSNVSSFVNDTQSAIPTLLLNLVPDVQMLPHQVVLSMRPEDEAVQAAAVLSKKNYQKPVLLVHKDNVSRRIANTFSHEWQRQTGKNIEVVYFEQGKNMQDELKASLDVDKSQQRVDDLNRRIKHTLKSEVRNRRDVDMIYIVGSPVQTKLLKPYIDVSISPFAQAIPVYASSRSHSMKRDNSDTRDLTGLTFTEMPWLLTSKQQNKSLAKLSQQLFPERSDNLQRIFAMGYDSLYLVDKVAQMQVHNYVRHFGQTGIIKLGKSNVLTRSFLWGRYQKTRVTEIVMDR